MSDHYEPGTWDDLVEELKEKGYVASEPVIQPPPNEDESEVIFTKGDDSFVVMYHEDYPYFIQRVGFIHQTWPPGWGE